MAMPGIGGIITCHIEDVDTLYASYLPFVSNGAMFVPSDRQYALGDEVFVAVTLPGSNERMPLNGKVVWINPKAQSNRPAGFAIRFGNDSVGLKVKNEVERLLTGKIESAQATYTM